MPQIISLIIFATAIWYMMKIKGQAGQVVDALSGGEKAYIWISSLLNPVFSGAVFYYGWRKLLPNRAKQANHISMWAFLIEFTVFIVFVYIGFKSVHQ